MNVVAELDGVQTLMGLQDGALVTGSRQQCTPILDDCIARQNAGFTGTSELKHAARLPLVIVEQYCNTAGITLEEWGRKGSPHLRRMLNDPDLSGFRIWTGKLA